ncbi:ABC transporter substrate-binding protein [Marinobacter subterrani]|uniref:Bacterial extracellular solute-binding protein n=1 Tax=Marinobacter subterrani TaxID=1658765 RepID=A0A0J7LWQ8_9GAMM|nr:ABC transporter substrate-binding protein [Marinobacter subterrani]KMQ73320.1 Bacterial extracellular solute-binding protein [Marinobacter subterrani]
MKKLIAAFVGSMVLAAAPLALSAEATKELKMAYDADPVTLDIHEQLSGGTLQLSHMAFDPLLRWTKDLGFEPRLAKSWERIDDKTMRFKLREGVEFHSGNELTAKDVKFTFDRLKQSQGNPPEKQR